MKDISRKKRIVYNSITNGIYQVVLLVSGLILPRFILRAFGSAYNGLVVSLTQFLGITEILTMGLAGTARVELYDSLAHNNTTKTNGIIKAINQYMYKAALMFFVYMVVLLVVYPKITNGEFSFSEIASLLLIIGAGNIITYICGYAYNVLLDADNTQYYYTVVKTILTIINVVVSILLIKLKLSIQFVKLFSGIILAIGPMFLFLFVPRVYKIDRKAPVDNSWRKNQKYAAANSIALIIHDNTDTALLSILTSQEVVSVYSVYNLVIKGIKGILGVFTSSMEPYFGNLWAKDKIEEMETTLTHYEYFIGSFISVSLSATLALILPFVSLYTKGVTDVEYIVPLFAFLIVIAELVRCVRIPYITIVQAAGRYKETQLSAFIEAILNITISIVMTLKYGLVGVVTGTIVANLYRTIHYSWYVSKHILKRSMKNTIVLLAWSLFNAIINSSIFNMLCSLLNFQINTWFKWCVGGLLVVFISFIEVVFTSVILYKNDLNWVFGLIKSYLRKFIKKNEKVGV